MRTPSAAALAIASLVLLSASFAQAGLVISTSFRECPLDPTVVTRDANGVYLAPTNGACVPTTEGGFLFDVKATCSTDGTVNVQFFVHGSNCATPLPANSSFAYYRSFTMPSDGSCFSTDVIPLLDFVMYASCGADSYPSVAPTDGLRFVVDGTCADLNTKVVSAVGAGGKCLSGAQGSSVRCNIDGTAVAQSCRTFFNNDTLTQAFRRTIGGIVFQPASAGCQIQPINVPQFPEVSASIAYQNMCSIAPTPQLASGAIAAICVIAVLLIGCNYWYFKSKAAAQKQAASSADYSQL